MEVPAVPRPGPGFSADYAAFKRAIIGQETGFRYGVPNAEGSGAMGVGQQMPATARALAQRLGMPYRPDLMAGNGPEARTYQDRITDAAVREAWEAGGGGRDLRTAAMYYHGGSNREIWGPKTRRYADEVLGRIGGR
jgi:soluble lytic murein transglycosylase-like protein